MSHAFVGFIALIFSCAGFAANMQHQPSQPYEMQTAGVLVVVQVFGEVKNPNDEARASLMIEEQDKDKAVAASRVNQKMKQGSEIVKREDPQAVLQTQGYYTYPVYADEPVQPRQSNRTRQLVGWRVGQYLLVTTTNLAALPKTIASAQRLLALNSLQFGLAEATLKRLEEQRIDAVYRNLIERISAIAKAMGRSSSDAILETIDFDPVGPLMPQDAVAMKTMRAGTAEAVQVEEPSFEPGETTLNTRIVAKVRFK